MLFSAILAWKYSSQNLAPGRLSFLFCYFILVAILFRMCVCALCVQANNVVNSTTNQIVGSYISVRFTPFPIRSKFNLLLLLFVIVGGRFAMFDATK